eukprot:scpid71609/ scgid24268/ 
MPLDFRMKSCKTQAPTVTTWYAEQCQMAAGQCQKTEHNVRKQKTVLEGRKQCQKAENSVGRQRDSVRRQQCTTLLCDHKHCRERLPECPCSPIFYSHHRYSLWCCPMLCNGR